MSRSGGASSTILPSSSTITRWAISRAIGDHVSQATWRRPFGAEAPKAMKRRPDLHEVSKPVVGSSRQRTFGRGPALAQSASAAACHGKTNSAGRPSCESRSSAANQCCAEPSLGQIALAIVEQRLNDVRGGTLCHIEGVTSILRTIPTFRRRCETKACSGSHRSRSGHRRIGVAPSLVRTQKPARMRSSVDFPAPDFPTRQSTSPG